MNKLKTVQLVATRNEIWSLISFAGAPSWFITFSPADNKHPISLYYADTQDTFSPEIRDYEQCYQFIAQNPVAGARFFHFMCELFIKHILGVGSEHSGFYGDTNAYYGVVEQQGRLTLHMHMLLWLKGCLTPQEIRERVMDPNSEFQKKLVEYLESVHIGEFLTGTMSQVKSKVDHNAQNHTYKDPTQTLPESPPSSCNMTHDTPHMSHECNNCISLATWWDKFKETTDDLILRSNVHNCGKYSSSNAKMIKKDRPTCINKKGKCKARFPRPTYDMTEVDPRTGALNVKKGEPWINTLTPLVTYLLRCNTDVTSLLSGTAIKAVVAYVSDYITKPGLKTYSIFDTIKSVFDKNSVLIGSSSKRKEKARRLMTQIINSLTAKLEIGGPMASLYLLGNPDHYTSHKFIPIYWKSYVTEVMKYWNPNDVIQTDVDSEKLVLQKKKGCFIGVSKIHDYVYRPEIYENLSLYEWIQCATRIKKPTKTASNIQPNSDIIDDIPQFMSQHKQPAEALHDIGTDCYSSDLDNDYDKLYNDLYDDKDKDMYFLNEHPLYDTHCIKFDSRKKYIVPNFVGGSLPRCDQGDREYYCTTMLTLFKPWRSGKDLKLDNDSWDDTFTSYDFTPDQIRIMEYFNIRYECLDARHDYSAQLRQENAFDDGIFPQFMTSETISDLDDNNINNGDEFVLNDDSADCDPDNNTHGPNYYSSLGKHGSLIKAQMQAIENVVRNAGWLNESPDGVISVNKKALESQINQPANKWKTAVQDKRQELLAERAQNIPATKVNNAHHGSFPYSNENDIMIIDQSYFEFNFRSQDLERHALINTTVTDFGLNTEQERAFRIIANHSSSVNNEQLNMYLGGMAGTGKSQVIKSLMDFFAKAKETHRFVILAPTGTAAAQQNGSTYHYFLGINPNASSRNEAALIAQLKTRLEGIDYIFIDEVSMLSCHELYKISAKLAKALNVNDKPFGGINMIFAGDFAQLPPVGGAPLYSELRAHTESAITSYAQEASIGKALWHQITTVVILRENMRQRTQSAEDALLRTALVNMCYGRCTPDDIIFLRSRIAGKKPGQPNVASKKFRNVPIICGLHSQKDQINLLGCERFASDTNQKLTNFYSVDKWGKEKNPAPRKPKELKSMSKPMHSSSDIE